MTSLLIELYHPSNDVGFDEHLVECPHAEVDWRTCDWCRWAISTREITTLLDARADIAALAAQDCEPSVAWVAASTEVMQCVESVDIGTIGVGSVRRIAERLRHRVREESAPLEQRLSRAVAPDGPIEQLCLRTSGAVTAAVIQMPRHHTMRERLAPRVRRRLDDLSSSISAQIQLTTLLPVVEQLHWRGLPRLRTQPHWSRRARPEDPRALRARQVCSSGLEAGSLEAFVVESVVTQTADALIDMAQELTAAAPPLALRRSAADRLSTRTLGLTHRIARFDWHLSFVDTGRADCWRARRVGDDMVTEVPWHVATAIDAGAELGLVSASHRDRPAVDSPTSADQLSGREGSSRPPPG